MLNIPNTTNKSIVAVINEGKNIEKRDKSVKGGDVTGKRNNNKKGGKPLINYNS